MKTRRLRECNRRVRRGRSGFTRMGADFLNRSGGQTEKFEKALVRVGVTLFEERVEALFLRVGDAGFVEQGDELVFGDFLHGDLLWLWPAVSHRRRRSVHYEAVDGSKRFLRGWLSRTTCSHKVYRRGVVRGVFCGRQILPWGVGLRWKSGDVTQG